MKRISRQDFKKVICARVRPKARDIQLNEKYPNHLLIFDFGAQYNIETIDTESFQCEVYPSLAHALTGTIDGRFETGESMETFDEYKVSREDLDRVQKVNRNIRMVWAIPL